MNTATEVCSYFGHILNGDGAEECPQGIVECCAVSDEQILRRE